MPVLAALLLTDTHNEHYDDFKHRMGRRSRPSEP